MTGRNYRFHPAPDLGRDKPLSFDWRAKDIRWSAALDLSPAPTSRHEITRDAILLDALVEAIGQDRFISYSRNKNFYSGKRRYYGTDYTYSTVPWAVDDLASASWL